MQRQVPVHYLRPNHAESTPASLIVFDTETRTLPGTDPEILALRLWAATVHDRRPPRGRPAITASATGHTAEQLAQRIEGWTVGRPTIWVYAHNLSFDLSTTRLPLILAGRGWEVTDAAVGGKAPWLRMRRKSHRLVLVDSWSWLPAALGAIGADLGIAKPPLPAGNADDATWFARCSADVTITLAALNQLMGWWDRNKLGRWTISGAATGWNAMRHRPTAQRVLIDPDPAGVAHDRTSIYGGRRGVWRVGTQNAGPFLELDFQAAYPTIAAHVPLPVGRRTQFDRLETDDWLLDNEDYGVVAQVVIDTPVPRWPVKVDGSVFYPVGRFVTTLAGPDIAEARRLGCLVSVGPGYVHQLGAAMMPWARWCLAVQYGTDPDSPPAARIACKSWGRTVLGKWAARSFTRTELGPSPIPGWSYEEGWDDATDSPGGVVDIAGRRWWVASATESDNAYPGIYAWVEAEVRTRLSRVIEAIGPGAVIQCDTDGLIVAQRVVGTRAAGGHLVAPAGMTGPARVRWVLDQIDPVAAPLLLRVKRSSAHVHVMGPQHLQVGEQRRLSGIPAGAVEVAPNTYTGATWPKLQWQMRHGDARGYHRPTVTAVLSGVHPPGWVTTSNTVLPPAATISDAGTTLLTAWPRDERSGGKVRLTEDQHPILAELW